MHDAKRMPKIVGYLMKSIWPHPKGNIGRAWITCIYYEGIDNIYKIM